MEQLETEHHARMLACAHASACERILAMGVQPVTRLVMQVNPEPRATKLSCGTCPHFTRERP